jgi:hypothetical protein
MLSQPSQGSFATNHGSRMLYPRGFYHPVLHPKELLLKKRKNLILYKTNL